MENQPNLGGEPQTTPPGQYPAPMTEQPAPPSSGSMAKGILVGLLVAVVVVAAYGAFAYLQGVWPFERDTKLADTTKMADWFTYRNERIGFEFRYPAELAPLSESVSTDFSPTFLSIHGEGPLSVLIWVNQPGAGVPGIYRPTEHTVMADEMTITYQKGRFAPMNAPNEPTEQIFWRAQFQVGENEYFIDFSSVDGTDYTELVERILSTFLFTDHRDTAGWSTYENPVYDFRFSYPSTWSRIDVANDISLVSIQRPGQPGGLITVRFEEDIPDIDDIYAGNLDAYPGWIFPPVKIIEVGRHEAFLGGYGDAGCASLDYHIPYGNWEGQLFGQLIFSIGGCSGDSDTDPEDWILSKSNRTTVEAIIDSFSTDYAVGTSLWWETGAGPYEYLRDGSIMVYERGEHYTVHTYEGTPSAINDTVTNPAGVTFAPHISLSEDGRYVAFSDDYTWYGENDVNSDIFLHDRVTGNTIRLTEKNNISSDSPFFSVDGSRVCYWRGVQDGTAQPTELWSIPLDGNPELSHPSPAGECR